MAQFASSTFAGTEGDNLSTFDTNWVKQSGSTGNAEIASGRARATTTATAHYYYNAAPTGADYTVSVDVYNPGTVANSTFGPSARMATGANTSYHARYSTVVGGLQLYKFVAGTATLLGSATKTAPAAGVSAPLVLSLSGPTIEVTWNGEGSPAISVTDTSITAAGYPGVRWATTTTPGDLTGWQGDNFSADEAGSGPVTIEVTPSTFSAVSNSFLLQQSPVVLSFNSAPINVSGEQIELISFTGLSFNPSSFTSESEGIGSLKTLNLSETTQSTSSQSISIITDAIISISSLDIKTSSSSIQLPVVLSMDDAIDQIVFNKLKSLGYAGTVQDMLYVFFGGIGALPDRENLWLVSQTGSTGPSIDLWKRYLNSLGYSGAVAEMLKQFWMNY